MATIETLRPEATASPAPVDAPLHDLAAFRAGRGEEDRLADLLAFALAVERAAPLAPGAVGGLRQEAARALHDHAFRFLHNRVEEIRREAVAEQLGRVPRPPGFVKLVLANLVALALAGWAAYWLALDHGALARVLGAGT